MDSDINSCLIVVALFYGALFFFDTFFKTCAHYPYLEFLRGTGLQVKFLHLHWTTSAFNRILLRWGSNYTRFLNVWFNLGLYLTLLLLPVSVLLLLAATIQVLFLTDSGHNQNVIIEPVIPGINLPGSELGYYSVTLIVCSLIHELGHALAAVKEDVHLVNVGVGLYFILPVAYVNLASEKLLALNPRRALRILCAGVWHNLVLAFVAALLYCSTPYIFSVFFYVNNGISVTSVVENSPLTGSRGLHVGDTITKINDCVVKDDDMWYNCLTQSRQRKPGFCANTDFVHSLDESIAVKQLSNGVLDCCGPHKPNHLCFEYVERNDGVLELPPHMCLPARKIVETFNHFCTVNTLECPESLHCIYPVLANSTALLKIKRLDKADVIYIGPPGDVRMSIWVSPFIPKHFFSTSFIPDVIVKLLRYIIVFSIGLALVNVIPCVGMDGQLITSAVTQILFGRRLKDRHSVNLVAVIISLFGTVLLVFHTVHIIWSKFLNKFF